MLVECFFDEDRTKTATFVVIDEKSKHCAIIDPVLDYNHSNGNIHTESADRVIKFIEINNLSIKWILETHIHADHLTASSYIKNKIGGKVGIGKNILKVLEYWLPIFQDNSIPKDGSQFDCLFNENDTFKIGNIAVEVMFTPGHTPACIAYHIQDSLFSGDTIFSPNVGTARTDFPGGSSKELFNSIQKIYKLPEDTKVYVGHEYPKDGNPVIFSTVKEQKERNVSINKNTNLEDYVIKMAKSQVNLPVPPLLLPSLQVNLNAGKIPEFIKIPVNKI